MKGLNNVLIQKIQESQNYLVTINKNKTLEKAYILSKDELIVWLEKRLSG